jgi:hypothetical protein
LKRSIDNLDFIRGVDVFLNTISAASLRANIEGLKSVGGNRETPVIHEQRVDARTLLLTPNTQTAILWSWLDLKDGPIVVEIPHSLRPTDPFGLQTDQRDSLEQ